MTPKQRIMAALNLQEPDKVPFADWTDPGIRQKLVRTLGYESLDDAQFHAKMGMDAICYVEDDYIAPQFCKKLFDEHGVAHLQGEGLITNEKQYNEVFILTDPNQAGYFDKAKRYGDRLCLWGNIDLNYTLSGGTEEEVEAEVREKIKALAPGGGYILATSNSITDFCKVENILAMIQAKEKYGWYPM
jgi:hypothetical protein